MAQSTTRPVEEVRLAILGAGTQGRNLVSLCRKLPGVQFAAVCDVWPYHQKYAAAILKRSSGPVNVYEDYRELLADEKGLDAVIIATPDWMHAEHTIACLKAGLHVYCEKPMATTAEDARAMVLAARESGKLLQIGTHRRSMPIYRHAADLVRKQGILGKLTSVSAHWNRPDRDEVRWSKDVELPAAVLSKYGYGSMQEFRNWRWYKKYGAGLMGDVGVHQLDVVNWFLDAAPTAVLASGGLDFHKTGQWYDNVKAVYDYRTAGMRRCWMPWRRRL